jgi:hypothetical protein
MRRAARAEGTDRRAMVCRAVRFQASGREPASPFTRRMLDESSRHDWLEEAQHERQGETQATARDVAKGREP